MKQESNPESRKSQKYKFQHCPLLFNNVVKLEINNKLFLPLSLSITNGSDLFAKVIFFAESTFTVRPVFSESVPKERKNMVNDAYILSNWYKLINIVVRVIRENQPKLATVISITFFKYRRVVFPKTIRKMHLIFNHHVIREFHYVLERNGKTQEIPAYG